MVTKWGGGRANSLLNDALIDAFNHYHMGITTENLAERYLTVSNRINR